MIDKFKYTDKEIKEILKSLTILCDTREQKNAHIIEYFDSVKVNYKQKKLDYGDYSFMIPKNPEMDIPRDLYFDKEIMIEKKNGLDELAGNTTKERDRFEKELALSPPNKVLLVENSTYSDLIEGKYRSDYSPKAYWATLHTFMVRYNIPVFFMPDKKYSGVFIRGYFTYYLKEKLR